ncbi:MAG TPA: GAF domain-containing protein [Terriglobales bacterium]|nr:GAF domain-containing protein [Terriglobales bacterium]
MNPDKTTPMSILQSIAPILQRSAVWGEKARAIAAQIHQLRNYRWVGTTMSVRNWFQSLRIAVPVHPRTPITKGLTGAAIREKKTIVAADVAADPRYLTAFVTTHSKIIIPVLDENCGAVIGTIDVEASSHAFSEKDQRILEACARESRGLWTELIPK